MSDTLAKIVAHKREEVAARKAARSYAELSAMAADTPSPRDFVGALRAERPYHALIAEIKRASPSRGLIRDDFDPPTLAQAYETAGAACLSVLTETCWFQGDDDHVRAVRAAVTLPILRKDFTVDAYQIAEARLIGADAILLIMAALSDDDARALEAVAMDLGLAVLIEVHDEAELDRALRLSSPLIGINNRNLKTLEVDIATSARLAASVPAGRLLIAESGLKVKADLDHLTAAGAGAFLVGETLMRADDVTAATRALIGS